MKRPALPPPPSGRTGAHQSLIAYPCLFPIKVMTSNTEGMVQSVGELAAKHDSAFDPKTIELRQSKGQRYLGLTLTVHATSQKQLNDLYQALVAHPGVRVVL